MFKTALKFIIYDKPKSIGALAGTILSVFLIGQQAGIFIFLTNAMSAYVRNNPDYIWVVDEKTTNANALATLDIRVGKELESIEGVVKAYPIVLASGSAKFANGKSSGITLVGTQYPEFAGWPRSVATVSPEVMLRDGAVVTDYFDQDALGDVEIGDYFEFNGKKVFVAGNTKGFRTFGGVVGFTTIDRARYLGNVSRNKASAYLVRWDPAVPQEQVIHFINREINGIRAWKAADFERQTVITVLASSGIAISFGTLIVFALIVGFVIIGLTLYSAAVDRIRDYGTLKAIGATNGYITRLIVTQAVLFAILGFVLGFALVNGFKQGVAQAGTLFEFPIWLELAFFGITLTIALFGSLFAVRRITSLEPSAVFRG
ncbi:MAG: FtsX-like permease family protein [Lewinellaceae bacterium]|nr:FtsX-like permease family protein [Lewinellaceae bacterium]